MSQNIPCRNGGKCNYSLCKFMHPPQCKYGQRCRVFAQMDFTCDLRHIPDCQFGDNCHRSNYVFNHQIPFCRYGQKCHDLSCSFKHINNVERLRHLTTMIEKERCN